MMDDLENFETEAELDLYREYHDILKMYKYVIETERRFYLANTVDMQAKNLGNDVYFEVTIDDAWVWDVYRRARFVKHAHIITFKDVNIEEIEHSELDG